MIFLQKQKKPAQQAVTVQTGNCTCHPFGALASYSPGSTAEYGLYRSLREAVPVIDSAIHKIVRLTGGFHVTTGSQPVDQALAFFLDHVNVGGNQMGIESYIASYLEQLLTYGSAVGEMVVSGDEIAALYNGELRHISIKKGDTPIELKFYLNTGVAPVPVRWPELIHYSVLHPDPGAVGGNSLLKGLPFVSDILLKIFHTIGTNWERLGNVRFAVTYKPQSEAGDKMYARERAQQMASQWREAMQAKNAVKDFVAVGDVNIKVIGADNQILDSSVPVRQMLEQIVAKLGLPPFMLGFSWSTTERMSVQQADLLTSELEAYRRILNPVILKTAALWLQLHGISAVPVVEWDDISLQDEYDLSRARLYNAQAAKIEQELKL